MGNRQQTTMSAKRGALRKSSEGFRRGYRLLVLGALGAAAAGFLFLRQGGAVPSALDEAVGERPSEPKVVRSDHSTKDRRTAAEHPLEVDDKVDFSALRSELFALLASRAASPPDSVRPLSQSAPKKAKQRDDDTLPSLLAAANPSLTLPAGTEAFAQEQVETPPTSPLVPVAKLKEAWSKQQSDPEWTRNTIAVMTEFLGENGLAPESISNVECRETLCKIDLSPNIPVERMFEIKFDLAASGIPVTPELEATNSGTFPFRITSAYLAKEGMEGKVLGPGAFESAPQTGKPL